MTEQGGGLLGGDRLDRRQRVLRAAVMFFPDQVPGMTIPHGRYVLDGRGVRVEQVG